MRLFMRLFLFTGEKRSWGVDVITVLLAYCWPAYCHRHQSQKPEGNGHQWIFRSAIINYKYRQHDGAVAQRLAFCGTCRGFSWWSRAIRSGAGCAFNMYV